MKKMPPLQPLPLPKSIRSRFVENVNGLTMHILESGLDAQEKHNPNMPPISPTSQKKPLVLLLHGFPELAYSWHKIIPGLAAKGFYVVAPDQRGYGRTTGSDDRFDSPELSQFRITNLVLDILCLVNALGYKQVHCVVGHDFGSPVAAHAGLFRPDIFRSVVIMSAPFTGVPSFRAPLTPQGSANPELHKALASLPRPRKHYQHYYSTPQANPDMHNPPEGLHQFMRNYFHMKSADYEGNTPFALKNWSAEELARMPTYYIMELNKTMPESVVKPSEEVLRTRSWNWLSEEELAVYTAEYQRTGFQGGLNWYRMRGLGYDNDLRLYAERSYPVPLLFVGGDADWGLEQTPGALKRMQKLTNFKGVKIIKGAGHWLEEQPEDVVKVLGDFLEEPDKKGKVVASL